MFEKIHLGSCEHILESNRSVPNLMIYGEFGRHFFEIKVKGWVIRFWGNIVKSRQIGF